MRRGLVGGMLGVALVAVSACATAPGVVAAPPLASDADRAQAERIHGLQGLATMGTLPSQEIAWLEDVRREGGPSEQAEASRLLVTNAWAAGQVGAWEVHVRSHLTQFEPTDAESAWNLGRRLFEQGRPHEALPWLNRAWTHRNRWDLQTNVARVPRLATIQALASRDAYGAQDPRTRACAEQAADYLRVSGRPVPAEIAALLP